VELITEKGGINYSNE